MTSDKPDAIQTIFEIMSGHVTEHTFETMTKAK